MIIKTLCKKMMEAETWDIVQYRQNLNLHALSFYDCTPSECTSIQCNVTFSKVYFSFLDFIFITKFIQRTLARLVYISRGT